MWSPQQTRYRVASASLQAPALAAWMANGSSQAMSSAKAGSAITVVVAIQAKTDRKNQESIQS